MSVRKLTAPLLALCAAVMLVPATAGAQAPPVPTAGTANTNLQKIPMSGKTRSGKAFRGRFSVDRFVTRHGKTYAVGTLKGKVGKRSVKRRDVAIPVAVAGATGARSAANCPILHLTLGPLDLNLLGLKVHLDRVVLDITAQSGPGNLLGNLLCGVAGLLDQPGLPVGQITGLLNILLQLINTPGLTSL